MSPLNAAICTTTYLERQKCYGPDKKILFKKPLFDLEVKSQGHRKVIMVRDTPPYGHAPTYQISLTYLERNNYLTLRSKSNKGHYGMRHTALWSCISLTYLERQKCYGPDNKILLKKTLFDIEVKGQGPTKVITVHNTPSYGHAPTYQISLTYLERQKMLWPGQENTI